MSSCRKRPSWRCCGSSVAERIPPLDPAIGVAVATKNEDKLRELLALWQGDPPLCAAGDEYPDVEEPFATYEANAIHKAKTLAAARHGPALADDSGIEVEAMQWAPGVLSARTPSPRSSWRERNLHILERIRAAGPRASRAARFVCVCALVVPGYEPVAARGEVTGFIADRPRGEDGFGYDPIFVYPPLGITFGELGAARKNEVSHRARAIRALQRLLRGG
jgi:XTP/dITP diphosphohydrolase